MAMKSPSLMEKSTPRRALTCPSSNSRVRALASRRALAEGGVTCLSCQVSRESASTLNSERTSFNRCRRRFYPWPCPRHPSAFRSLPSLPSYDALVALSEHVFPHGSERVSWSWTWSCPAGPLHARLSRVRWLFRPTFSQLSVPRRYVPCYLHTPP